MEAARKAAEASRQEVLLSAFSFLGIGVCSRSCQMLDAKAQLTAVGAARQDSAARVRQLEEELKTLQRRSEAAAAEARDRQMASATEHGMFVFEMRADHR
jgi:hypothetical protein